MKQFITALMAASLMGFAAISGAQTGENADTPTPVNQVGQAPVMAPAATLPGGVPQVQVPPTVQTGVPATGTPAPDTIIVPSGASWGEPGAQMDSNSRNPDRHTLDINIYSHNSGGSVNRSRGSTNSSYAKRSTSNTSTKQSTPAKTPGKGKDNQMTWTPLAVLLTAAGIIGLLGLIGLLLLLRNRNGQHRQPAAVAPINPFGLNDPGRRPTGDFDPHQAVHSEVIEEVTAGRSYRKITPTEVLIARANSNKEAAGRIQAALSSMGGNSTPTSPAPLVVINNGGVPGWPADPNHTNTGRIDAAPAPQKIVIEHVVRQAQDNRPTGGDRGGDKGGKGGQPATRTEGD